MRVTNTVLFFKTVNGQLTVVKRKYITFKDNIVYYKKRGFVLDLNSPAFRTRRRFFYYIDVDGGQLSDFVNLDGNNLIRAQFQFIKLPHGVEHIRETRITYALNKEKVLQNLLFSLNNGAIVQFIPLVIGACIGVPFGILIGMVGF